MCLCTRLSKKIVWDVDQAPSAPCTARDQLLTYVFTCGEAEQVLQSSDFLLLLNERVFLVVLNLLTTSSKVLIFFFFFF